MKKFKKLWAMLLAMVMVLAMAVPAFAASITIGNAAKDETYTAYKLFDVTNSGDAYSYFTTNENLKNALVRIGLTFTESADGTEWIVNQETTAGNEVAFKTETGTMTAAQLATALNNLNDKTVLGTGTDSEKKEVEGVDTVIIENLDAGYYFVDSTLGSLCALNTTTDTVTINEKNSIPSITKEVKEDSTNTYGDSATIDVIDTVSYQLTVNTGTNDDGDGTGVDANYVITDVLPAGFSYKYTTELADGITIKQNGTNWTNITDYTVAYTAESRTLVITLLETGELGNLGKNADIVITYDATVNATDVVMGGAGNVNNVTLAYHNQEVPADAVAYTFEIGGYDDNGTPVFQKIDGTTHTALTGVTFTLSRTVGTDTTYATVDANGYLTGWVTAATNNSKLTTDDRGVINVKGLDAGTYILTETETLDGYNLLEDTITVVITEAGVITYELTDDNTDTPANTITVENFTGQILPSTGGMGTTMIYVIGGILVFGAAVLLVTRRRMSSEE